MPLSRAFLYISFWIPSTGAPPSGSPNRASAERDAPFQEPTFHYLSQFPENGPPTQVPQRDPCGERHLSPKPSSTHPLIIRLSLKVPGNGTPASCSPSGVPWRELLRL